jgi:predicted transcriptional regulator of viral defense system
MMRDRFNFLKILKVIEENHLTFFKSNELAEMLGVEPKSIQNYLETLANNELILRIEKGKYCRTYLKDPLVLGANLVTGGVISHNTALIHHGLAPDNSPEVFVSSNHQKSNKRFLGYYFRFIRIRPNKYFGFRDENNETGSFRVTDPEKTILDCFDLPHYSARYDQLLDIFRNTELDEAKLTTYGVRMGNLSVLKRLAFLTEHYGMTGFGKFRKMVSNLLNEKYTLLDPSGPELGPFCSKWRIRNNMSLSSMPSIRSMY